MSRRKSLRVNRLRHDTQPKSFCQGGQGVTERAKMPDRLPLDHTARRLRNFQVVSHERLAIESAKVMRNND